ncbi:MAG: divalent-cation tolerance protein CutA [Proteobacteria bacterium]|nr:divalent-cation tolerance protein CutA [Pseudomonadota bacterium]
MLIIYTTISNAEQAEVIAQTLLTEQLVACVNMWPINSMYTWNGKIEKTSEIVMLLKTKEACEEPVYQRLKELHSYECPAIITLDVKHTNPDFANWVETQTNYKC